MRPALRLSPAIDQLDARVNPYEQPEAIRRRVRRVCVVSSLVIGLIWLGMVWRPLG